MRSRQSRQSCQWLCNWGRGPGRAETDWLRQWLCNCTKAQADLTDTAGSASKTPVKSGLPVQGFFRALRPRSSSATVTRWWLSSRTRAQRRRGRRRGRSMENGEGGGVYWAKKSGTTPITTPKLHLINENVSPKHNPHSHTHTHTNWTHSHTLSRQNTRSLTPSQNSPLCDCCCCYLCCCGCCCVDCDDIVVADCCCCCCVVL